MKGKGNPFRDYEILVRNPSYDPRINPADFGGKTLGLASCELVHGTSGAISYLEVMHHFSHAVTAHQNYSVISGPACIRRSHRTLMSKYQNVSKSCKSTLDCKWHPRRPDGSGNTRPLKGKGLHGLYTSEHF